MASGTVADGAVEAFPQPAEPREVSLRHARTDALLGISIEPAKAVEYLKGLGLEPVASDEISATFRIPSWRVDLKREADLIEEVVTRTAWIKSATTPMGCLGENEFDAVHDALAETRDILSGLAWRRRKGKR